MEKRRGLFSKEYRNPDGTFLAEVFSESIHFLDQDGHFQNQISLQKNSSVTTTDALIKFTMLPSLPSSAKILQAYLSVSINLPKENQITKKVISLHQVTSEHMTGEFLRNARDVTFPFFMTKEESSVSVSQSGDQRFDITNLLKKWYGLSPNDHIANNYGVLLKTDNHEISTPILS